MRSNVLTLNDIRWDKKAEVKTHRLANFSRNQSSTNRRRADPLPQRPRQPPPRPRLHADVERGPEQGRYDQLDGKGYCS